MLFIIRKISLITKPIAPMIKKPIEHCLAILTNSIYLNNYNFDINLILFLPFLSGF